MATIHWDKEWESLEKLLGGYLSHLLEDANKPVMVTEKKSVFLSTKENGGWKFGKKEKEVKVERTLFEMADKNLWGKKFAPVLGLYLGLVDCDLGQFFIKIERAGQDAVRAHQNKKGATKESLNKIKDVAEINKIKEEVKIAAAAFRARMPQKKDLTKDRLEKLNFGPLKEMARDLALRRGDEGTIWFKFLKALDGLLQKMGFLPIGVTGVKVVKGLRQFEKRVKQQPQDHKQRQGGAPTKRQ